MDRRVCRISVAICIVSLTLIPVASVSAVTIITWDAAGAGDSWGTAMNWDGDQLPTAGDIVLFNDGGSIFTPGLVTNVLDADRTVNGLIYRITTDNFHTTDLGGFTLTMDGNLTANSDFVGNTTTTIENGNLVVGTPANPVDLLVGQRTIGGSGYAAVLDLTDVGSLNADLADLKVGTTTNVGTDGNLKLAMVNVIDANTIVIGKNGAAQLHLGQTNTILANDFIVAKNLSNSTVDIVNGGTLKLGTVDRPTFLSIADQDFNQNLAERTGRVDPTGGTLNAHLSGLIVGHKFGIDGKATGQLFAGGGGTVTIGDVVNKADVIVDFSNSTRSGAAIGTVDFSGLDSFTANLNEMLIGVRIAGSANGNVTLASTNVIDANSIVVGDGGGAALHLGQSNTILTDDFIVAKDFSNATVDIVGGGTLNLGSADRRTFLSIADQDINTNSSLNGRLNLTGGNFNAYLDGLIVGRKFGGPGTTTGELLAGNGGSVTIGDTGNTAEMIVGRSVAGGSTIGIVDFGGLDSFTANLNRMLIGTKISGAVSGTVTLAAANTIDANSIVVGDGNGNATLHLGQTNDILVDDLLIGGSFNNGRVDMPAGGTLNLGAPDRRTSLTIGKGITNTNSTFNGTLDLAGGTLIAYLDRMIVGEKDNDPGSQRGNLFISNQPDNFIDANSIFIGGTRANGTVDFGGGTMAARVIERGNGTAIFNWLGGTLHVDRFGSPATTFNLANNGLGALAPGTSAGLTEVWGNYTQSPGATMQIESGGTAPRTQYDQVAVSGSASLAGALQVNLINAFVPGTPDPLVGGDGDSFTILSANAITGGFDSTVGLDYDNPVETGRLL